MNCIRNMYMAYGIELYTQYAIRNSQKSAVDVYMKYGVLHKFPCPHTRTLTALPLVNILQRQTNCHKSVIAVVEESLGQSVPTENCSKF